MTTCFTPSVNVTTSRPTSFLSGITETICTNPQPFRSSTRATPKAADLPPPGIPSGQDPLEGAPLRSFVPRPVETYDNRSFTAPIPQTWEGEVTTIGVADIEPVTKESLAASREIVVDAAATSAFLEYSDAVRADRQQSLEDLAKRNAEPVYGRATCGEEEGRGFISNFDTRYLTGVKAVEYWGVPNGPVPRLFGGPSS